MDLNLIRDDDSDQRILGVIIELASWQRLDDMGYPDDPTDFVNDLWKANFFEMVKRRKPLEGAPK